jgi:hypothetical protein
MMLRVNNEYLDFNGDIELEKHAKLFEQIDQTQGDFSYMFEIPKTDYNRNLLGIQAVDQLSKAIYLDTVCEILDDDGFPLYRGSLRIERVNKVIEASFFSGNYNWMSQITGNVTDLNFDEYDIELSEANIVASWALTEGLVFPLIDSGGLITRSTANLKAEDFTGCMYVKTIFKKIFSSAGIKLKGELLTDFIYNNAIVCKNNKNENAISDNSCYVEKSTTTTRVTELVQYKMIFQNDSVYPFYDGAADSFNLGTSTFTAPVKMKIDIECTLQAAIVDAGYNNRIYIYINGAYTFVDIGLAAVGLGGLYNSSTPGDQEFFSLIRTYTLEAGDTLEVYSEWQQSTGSTQNDVLSGTLKITPTFIYQVYGVDAVPAWTKADFISEYIKLFNVISDFDPISKELTFNLFSKLKSKTPIDISDNIEVVDEDYTDFISSYAKNNYFKYGEGDDEEIRDYNVNKFIKYGAGVITCDNDYIQEGVDALESRFVTPISYINPALGASLERVKIAEVSTDKETECTSVTDSAGVARFNIADDYYLAGDIVRVENAQNPEYNGDFIVDTRASGYITLKNVPYTSDSTATISRVNFTYSSNDNVFLFINIPDYPLASFSSVTPIDLDGSDYTDFGYAYFNLLTVGLTVNDAYKQGLSFGSINSSLNYQRTLLDSYWGGFQGILNDPVKLICDGTFSKQKFLSLSPLSPVYIKTKESTNLYYTNQILGYKRSYQPCEVELIKLA